MKFDWPSLATLAAVAASWVGIWWLRKRSLNFSVIALFALAAGIPIGYFAGEHVSAIDPIGRIYINVLLATVGPLILVAIVSAITSLGSIAKLRSIGLRSALWLLGSNAIAIVLALGLAFIFRPGAGVDGALGAIPSDTISGQVQQFSQVVVSFFPTNVVGSFASNSVIPIILIAVTLSVAYLSLVEKEGEKVKPFATGAEAIKLVVFKVVSYVIRLTPYAIVALTASMVGSSTNLGKSFWSLLGLLALVWVACAIHTYAVNSVILSAFANVSPVAFFRKIFPAQLLAFTTQSSAGTLPVTTRQLTHKVGVHPEVAHFTAPLGSTIGMPGCAGIWPILIAVWGINAYGIAYSRDRLRRARGPVRRRLRRHRRRPRRRDGVGRHGDVGRRTAARVRRGDDPDQRDRGHGAHRDQRHHRRRQRHRRGAPGRPPRRRDLRGPQAVRRRRRPARVSAAGRPRQLAGSRTSSPVPLHKPTAGGRLMKRFAVLVAVAWTRSPGRRSRTPRV